MSMKKKTMEVVVKKWNIVAIEEKAEIVLYVIMAQCSDTSREKGNKFFKEKKVGFQLHSYCLP